MVWVRLEDGFATHPKVEALGDRSFRIHCKALGYCAHHLTDGLLPDTWVRQWPTRYVEECIREGVWERAEDGVLSVHDFLVYNPSREAVDAKRTAASTAARMRWGDATGNADGNAKRIARRTRAGLGRAGGSNAEGIGFAEFWAAFPRKVGKPKAAVAFEQACRRAEAAIIVAGAERYRDDPNRDGQFTAHPTTWLNRDGWEDDALPARGSGPAPTERETTYYEATEPDPAELEALGEAMKATPWRPK